MLDNLDEVTNNKDCKKAFFFLKFIIICYFQFWYQEVTMILGVILNAAANKTLSYFFQVSHF